MALHGHKRFVKTLNRGPNAGKRLEFAVGDDGSSRPVRVVRDGSRPTLPRQAASQATGALATGRTRSAQASAFGKETSAAARAGTLAGTDVAARAQAKPSKRKRRT